MYITTHRLASVKDSVSSDVLATAVTAAADTVMVASCGKLSCLLYNKYYTKQTQSKCQEQVLSANRQKDGPERMSLPFN